MMIIYQKNNFLRKINFKTKNYKMFEENRVCFFKQNMIL